MNDWFYRNEAEEPWVLAACTEHGPELEALGFRRGLPRSYAVHLRHAELCAVCAGTITIDQVRACQCQTAPAICPVHGQPDDDPPTRPIDVGEAPTGPGRVRRSSSLPPVPAPGLRVVDGGDEEENSPNVRRAIAWWNGMTEAQRVAVMQAGSDVLGYGPSIAEVWNLRVAGEITGPRPPPGAEPVAVPPGPRSIAVSPGPRSAPARDQRRGGGLQVLAGGRGAALAEPAIETMSRAAAAAFFARAEEVTRLRRERWGEGGDASMTRLARRFPSLRDAHGVDPWDAMTFLRWACDADLTSGMLHTVRFVLQVWNSATDWVETAAANGLAGRHLTDFSLVAACGAWDEDHRAACLAWLEAPFFP